MSEVCQKFVDDYFESLSFDFSTFKEAESEVKYEGYYIKYDRLSLCCYSHSFPTAMWRDFSKKMSEKYKVCDKEIKKIRIEYAILLAYAEIYKDFLTVPLLKQERPDFVIHNKEKRVGVEITELITQSDKVLEKIFNENNNCKADVAKVMEQARNKHGKKALRYGYHNINGTLAMSSNLISLDARKKYYAERIMAKCSKYKDVIGDFDEFIILCFLSDPLICEEYEVREIMDMFFPDKEYGNLKVSILYSDKNNNVRSLEKKF